MARGTDEVKLSDDDLPDSEVKGGPGIEEETEHGLVEAVDGVIDSLGQEEDTEFMAHPRTEELRVRLCFRPLSHGQLSDVNVKGFCGERTGQNCPITGCCEMK